MLLLICTFEYCILFLKLGEGAGGVETETGTTVEAGVVVGDDGCAVDLLGVAKDLIDVGQGAREGDLVAVGPDDTSREVTTTSDHPGLCQSPDAFVCFKETVQMAGVWLTYLIAVEPQPECVDSGVGEEVTTLADGLLVGELEGFALREQRVQHVGMLLVVAVAGAEVEVVGGEVVHVVVPQEEHDLVGVGDIEVEDVHEFVDGGLGINAFLCIGVDIVAEEHDLVVFFGVILGISPERATVDIGDNQYFPVLFHCSFHFCNKGNFYFQIALNCICIFFMYDGSTATTICFMVFYYFFSLICVRFITFRVL